MSSIKLDSFNRMKPFIHLWLPNIFETKGGIQAYSALLLKAWQELLPEAHFDIFLKNDRALTKGSQFLPQTRFHFFGQFPQVLRTYLFSTSLMGHCLFHSPDLVVASHLHFTKAAFWLKRIKKTPYWVTAHGIEAWALTDPALKEALKAADRVLCVSEFTRQKLLKEQSLDASRVSILPDTFDECRFRIGPKPAYLLKRYGLKADQPVLFTVARLEREERYKGYDKVLEAITKVRDQCPNVHYVLAGKGSDLTRIGELISRMSLEPYVTLAGFVADEELCDHYNLCDVFVMPSTGEGFGIVFLEAMACGKPVIAGNKDGSVEALCNGELGALVDPDNIDILAETIIQILKKTYPNPLVYQQDSLRKKVIERFGFDAFKRALSLNLDDLLPQISVKGGV